MNVETRSATPAFPWAQDSFTNWLFSSLYQKEDGGWGMAGAPAYQGQLSPNLTETILPAVWGAYNSGGNQGTDFLANYLKNGWMMGSELGNQLNNISQYGSVGGYAGQLLNTMAQYGGVGEPAKAMSNAWQYGAPSQAGQPIALTSQFGGYGDWGKMLQQRASGQGGGALQFLAPFLTRGSGYQSSTMPQQGGR